MIYESPYQDWNDVLNLGHDLYSNGYDEDKQQKLDEALERLNGIQD